MLEAYKSRGGIHFGAIFIECGLNSEKDSTAIRRVVDTVAWAQTGGPLSMGKHFAKILNSIICPSVLEAYKSRSGIHFGAIFIECGLNAEKDSTAIRRVVGWPARPGATMTVKTASIPRPDLR